MERNEQFGGSPLPLITKSGLKLSLLLVVAPFYKEITSLLLQGAITKLRSARINYKVIEVPGALEIPPAIKIASENPDYDGFVALGCVIRGETIHFEIVAQESARGIMDLGINGLCIGNGIITVENTAQALARANPQEGDKGGEAVEAALQLILLQRLVIQPKDLIS